MFVGFARHSPIGGAFALAFGAQWEDESLQHLHRMFEESRYPVDTTVRTIALAAILDHLIEHGACLTLLSNRSLLSIRIQVL